MHPQYPFNPTIKLMQYTGIFSALNKEVKNAVTFPHLSDYKMERQLIGHSPDVKIYAFEKDPVLFNKIEQSFDKPKNIELINADAEEYLSDTDIEFDLIFLDYCGAARRDINGIVRDRLSNNGVLALTEFLSRGAIKYKFEPKNDFESIVSTKYGENNQTNMQFRVFRKVDALFLKVPRDYRIVTERMGEINYATQKQLGKAFLKYKSILPETEIEICKLHFIKGIKQKELALMLGMTQGAISSRIAKMKKRIAYAQQVADTYRELEELKEFFIDDGFSVDIIRGMVKTTSQSVTAKILNKKYNLKGGAALNQVKVRYRWKLIKEKISHAMSLPGYDYLKKFYTLINIVDNNIYTLHEVKLPQFEGRKNENLVLISNVAA